jgi:Fic family protein
MADEIEGDRKSKAASPVLIEEPLALARREVENGLKQFDQVLEIIEHFRDTARPFKLRPSMIQGLQRTALDGISTFAGITRPAGIEIGGSKHQPPGAHMVPELLEHMCDYVSDHWNDRSALHLAAYVMWRLNWIHPFVDGNGRTSRAISYLVLCVRLGYPLPGTHTIPEQIAANKKPYYDALEAADIAFEKTDQPDVHEMEKLLGDYLSAQLVAVVEQATGGKLS